MVTRASIIVSGHVQGASFRDKVEEIVFRNFRGKITGQIKNLKDGTVQIICEGDKKTITRFLKAIHIDRWPIVVERINTVFSKPLGKFKGFQVINRKATNLDILERLDLGMTHMGEMKKGLDINTGTIITMDRGVGSCFQALDKKYGEFGEKLDTIGEDVKGIKQMADEMREMKDLLAKFVDYYISKNPAKQ